MRPLCVIVTSWCLLPPLTYAARKKASTNHQTDNRSILLSGQQQESLTALRANIKNVEADSCTHNLVHGLAARASEHPYKLAYVFPNVSDGGYDARRIPTNSDKEQSLSFLELSVHSELAAGALRRIKVQPGTPVLLLALPPGRVMLILMYALFKIGAVPVVPPTPRSLIKGGVRLIKDAIKETQPKVFIGSWGMDKIRGILGVGRHSLKTWVMLDGEHDFGEDLFPRLEIVDGTTRSKPPRSTGRYIQKFATGLIKGADHVFGLPGRALGFGRSKYSLKRLLETERSAQLDGNAQDHTLFPSFNNLDESYKYTPGGSENICGPSPALIMYTTGSTGSPKPVIYTHRMLRGLAKGVQGFGFPNALGDIDYGQSGAFVIHPLIGLTTVMDMTKPSFIDPQKRIEAMKFWGATTAFMSPSVAGKLAQFGMKAAHPNPNGTVPRLLPNVRLVYIGGETVMKRKLDALKSMISEETGRIVGVYGATEGFPLTTIDYYGADGGSTWDEGTLLGAGFCVGMPFMGLSELRIETIPELSYIDCCQDRFPQRSSEIGEILVAGSVVSQEYGGANADDLNRKLKSMDETGKVWHRTGDVGYTDHLGRLWILGRRKHKVEVENRAGKDVAIFPNQVEPIFNEHFAVSRSALVDVKHDGKPIVVIELRTQKEVNMEDGRRAQVIPDWKHLASDLHELWSNANHLTRQVGSVHLLLHRGSFQTDPRHESKIERGMLGEWAAKQLHGEATFSPAEFNLGDNAEIDQASIHQLQSWTDFFAA